MWPFSSLSTFSMGFMGQDSRPIDSISPSQNKTLNPEGLKPCCACPETKRVRDDCFLRYGPPDESSESAIKCADLMAAHRACMAQYGFQV